MTIAIMANARPILSIRLVSSVRWALYTMGTIPV